MRVVYDFVFMPQGQTEYYLALAICRKVGEWGCWERGRDVKIRRKHHKSFRSLWVHLKLSKNLQKETTFYQTDHRDILLKQGHITTVNTLHENNTTKKTLGI